MLVALAQRAGFEMRHVWYLSVATVWLQTLLNLGLLLLEFRRRLRFEPLPESPPLAAAT